MNINTTGVVAPYCVADKVAEMSDYYLARSRNTTVRVMGQTRAEEGFAVEVDGSSDNENFFIMPGSSTWQQAFMTSARAASVVFTPANGKNYSQYIWSIECEKLTAIGGNATGTTVVIKTTFYEEPSDD